MEGRKDGRMEGTKEGKAGIRIAYSNQKFVHYRGLPWSSSDHTGLATRTSGVQILFEEDKFLTFQILLLKANFKSLTTFGENL